MIHYIILNDLRDECDSEYEITRQYYRKLVQYVRENNVVGMSITYADDANYLTQEELCKSILDLLNAPVATERLSEIKEYL